MSTSPQTRAAHHRQFALAAALTAATLLAFAVVLFSDAAPGTRQIVSDVGFVVVATAACASWLLALRRNQHRPLAWKLLAITTGSWAVGNMSWFYFQLIADSQPYPGPHDAFYFIALFAAIGALITFPAERVPQGERLRWILDAVIVGGSVLFTSAVLALGKIFTTEVGGSLAKGVYIAYPIADLIVGTLAILLLARAGRGSRLQLALITSGFGAYALADTLYSNEAAKGTFAIGTPLDLGWMAGYALLGLAAWAPTAASDSEGTRSWRVGSVVRPVLMLVPLVVAVVLSAGQQIDWERPLLVVTGVVVLVALGTRQVLLAVDNAALRRDLESQVERRTAELNSLAERSKAILDSVGDAIYGIDDRGYISFVNPAAQAMLGYSAEDLLGRHGHEALHATRSDGSAYPWNECPIHEVLGTGATVHTGEEYRASDGTWIAIEMTASPVLEDGRLTGAVVAFRDVRKRREVERMKDEFVSVVSHELRTPLTSIRGSLGLVSSGSLGELSPKAARMIDVAAESTDRLTRLINDILDVERIESGTMPMERLRVDVGDLIMAAMRELQPMAAAAGVELISHAEEAEVEADADRIVQTIMNLVSNAVKFSTQGDAVVVRAAVDAADVVVSVADQGRGVPADMLDAIFGRFQQVDSSDARLRGGTGLGLAISKGIVEKHGGRIWVDSTVGVGSVFRFTLPVVRRPRSTDRIDAAPAVLICDDDHDLRDVVTAQLADVGFRTITTADATDAFRRAVEEQPAAVVLDLNMPLPDGRDAFRNLLLHPETRDVPVVVLSIQPPEAEPEIAARAAGWVTKPADPATLIRVVSAAVRRRPRPVVLVVEDDQPLVDVFAASLEGHGLLVSSAASAGEAVTLSKCVLPDVLLLDVALHDSDGYELVRRLRADLRMANVPVVVYTGLELDRASKRDLTLGRTVFLTKAKVGPAAVEAEVLRFLQPTDFEEVRDVAEPARAGR